MVIMSGLGVKESYVPLNVTVLPTCVASAIAAWFFAYADFAAAVVGSASGAFRLKVKSAVFDCTASSETATCNCVGVDAITSAPGICTDLPLIVSQTLAAS